MKSSIGLKSKRYRRFVRFDVHCNKNIVSRRLATHCFEFINIRVLLLYICKLLATDDAPIHTTQTAEHERKSSFFILVKQSQCSPYGLWLMVMLLMAFMTCGFLGSFFFYRCCCRVDSLPVSNHHGHRRTQSFSGARCRL